MLPEFWIDVGGTFTDCYLRQPDGALLRHKLLSSGITKGAAGADCTASLVLDPSRDADPPQFWNGWRLRLLDQQGSAFDERRVVDFDPQRGFTLDRPWDIAPPEGTPYELTGELEAPLVAIRYLLGLGADENIPPVTVRLGTTRGTNALLTRRGARTAFVTTRGFADVLRIGYQNRPRLFELAIRKPQPLFEEVVEVDERHAADGEVLHPPNPDAVRSSLKALRKKGVQSLAICLLHASDFPAHEQLVEGIAREVGFDEISASHRVAPLVKIVARGDTTVVDAFLNPVLREYVASLSRRLAGSELKIMTSAGGLVGAAHFVGKDSILSGPAGGVVGFSRVAAAAGFERAIGFDMGGTSTDVSRWDGRHELEDETEKAGVRIVAPMMSIETVAAGGGSICQFDGVKLVVGPDSAGADPGPACYGRGGPLTVTDLNFYLGKILPEHFPFPLDRAAVQRRLEALAEEVRAVAGHEYTPHALCDGLVRIANENMVQATRTISIAKGCDPREYALVAFGGAAGQHACAVASELGMRSVLLHPDAGILSAYGIGLADITRHRVEGIYAPLESISGDGLNAVVARLTEDGRQEVLAEGVPADCIAATHALDLRYQGTDAALTIEAPEDGDFVRAFAAEHRARYGYVHDERDLEVVAARVEVVGRIAESLPPATPRAEHKPDPEKTTAAWFNSEPHDVNVYARSALRPGDRFFGPAIVWEERSTTVVDPGWRADVLSGGELLLTRLEAVGGEEVSAQADPVMLEIFNSQFAGIAEQMGVTLRNTASSVNVKERLDFSCALFTPSGELVVNAPHIPVHLGAMSETVRCVLRDNPDLGPGDVIVTNDPFRGGSHLPDVTVVTPVHDTDSRELLFFTASRAHHAEIGGIRPGSMPPHSQNLAEEGVLIRNFKLVDAGNSRSAELRRLLEEAPYPSRAVDDNLADIAAQVAANRQGARDLERLIARYSLPVVQAYMGHIQDAAAENMRRSLARLESRRYEFADRLDNGAMLHVALDVAGDGVTVDFSGTDSVSRDNLNANRAIVTAAVLYVMRLLIDKNIPLNEGVLAPVEIVLPPCLLNPPEGPSAEECAAVVGGNVETSQRVVDVLLGALGLAGASQGTMNNLLFGDAKFGYYETICGGAGATASARGADAVHTHMTNTRLTDPEILERRYPVRLEQFAIRRGSGGDGQHRGGDGVIRRLRFLRPLDVSILSGRRAAYAPYGMSGGEPGASGFNRLERADGRSEELPYRAQFRADAGDVLVIETPGGGGFGKP